MSIAIVSVPIQGQDGKAIIGAAAKAMGAENLKTIQLTGSGSCCRDRTKCESNHGLADGSREVLYTAN